jgi:hypothetical protein
MEDDEDKYFEDLNCSQARYISKEEILTRIEMHVLNAMIIGKEHSFDLIKKFFKQTRQFFHFISFGKQIQKEKI